MRWQRTKKIKKPPSYSNSQTDKNTKTQDTLEETNSRKQSPTSSSIIRSIQHTPKLVKNQQKKKFFLIFGVKQSTPIINAVKKNKHNNKNHHQTTKNTYLKAEKHIYETPFKEKPPKTTLNSFKNHTIHQTNTQNKQKSNLFHSTVKTRTPLMGWQKTK